MELPTTAAVFSQVLLEQHSIHSRPTSFLFNLGSHKGALLHTGVCCDIAVLFAGQLLYDFFTKIDIDVTVFLLGARDSPSCNSLKPVSAGMLLPNRVPDTGSGSRALSVAPRPVYVRRHST